MAAGPIRRQIDVNSQLFTFVGGKVGNWSVVEIKAVAGDSLMAPERLDVVHGSVSALPDDATWVLRGVTSNVRYVTRGERELLVAKQAGMGRPEATRAALIPIRKAAGWWDLPQDERRRIFEDSSHHVKTGLKYLPAIARRLHQFLDATDAGVPLYERHGFRKLQPCLRYGGTPTCDPHSEVRPMTGADLGSVCQLDQQWWGARRRFFLQRRLQLHPELCLVLEQYGAIQGYLMGRQRGDKLWVGPWGVSQEVAHPEVLLTSLPALSQVSKVHAGLLYSNTRGHQVLLNLGFEVAENPPWRMVQGEDVNLGDRMEVLANGTSAKG
jgi:GNAT acetyltransferase-like protein